MGEQKAVVSLYDPESLQVRADVRFEDASRVRPGQRVQITSPVLSGRLEGEVLFMTSEADVQKNTIQVKVSVEAAPDVLRPEMLVQVTFLAPKAAAAPTETVERVRTLAPRSLILDEGGKKAVWVLDAAAGVARKRAVETGAVVGDLVEVTAGLHVGDRLIVSGREDLSDGQRVRVTGEDSSLLSAPQAPAGKGHGKH